MAIATLGLGIAAMYSGGGQAALKRQFPQIVLLAIGLVGGAVVLPYLSAAIGDLTLVLIILPISLLTIWSQTRRIEGRRLEEAQRASRSPVLRVLIAAWIALLIGSTIFVFVFSGPAR